MADEFFDPAPGEQIVVLIHPAILHKAERLIDSCEPRNREDAPIPFDNIFDRVTGSDPKVTDWAFHDVVFSGAVTE